MRLCQWYGFPNKKYKITYLHWWLDKFFLSIIGSSIRYTLKTLWIIVTFSVRTSNSIYSQSWFFLKKRFVTRMTQICPQSYRFISHRMDAKNNLSTLKIQVWVSWYRYLISNHCYFLWDLNEITIRASDKQELYLLMNLESHNIEFALLSLQHLSTQHTNKSELVGISICLNRSQI